MIPTRPVPQRLAPLSLADSNAAQFAADTIRAVDRVLAWDLAGSAVGLPGPDVPADLLDQLTAHAGRGGTSAEHRSPRTGLPET